MKSNIIFVVILSFYTIFSSCLSTDCDNGYRDNKVKYEYHDNGNLKSSCMVINCVYNGNYMEYYEDGSLKIEGFKKGGLYINEYKLYDKTGLLIKHILYDSIGNLLYSKYYEKNSNRLFEFEKKDLLLTIYEDNQTNQAAILNRIKYNESQLSYLNYDFDYKIYRNYIIQSSLNQVNIFSIDKPVIIYSLLDTISKYEPQTLKQQITGIPPQKEDPILFYKIKTDTIEMSVYYVDTTNRRRTSEYFYFITE